MKTEQEQIEAATMAIAREVCPYYNRGRCDLGSPTCHKTSIQPCSRKEAIIDSLNRTVKQVKIDVLKELKTRHDYAIKNMGYPWDITQQIDELIKEVQNAEDKG